MRWHVHEKAVFEKTPTELIVTLDDPINGVYQPAFPIQVSMTLIMTEKSAFRKGVFERSVEIA